jgi:hypothetical protein
MAYLKLGIYGEAGSGKTFTASSVAIGLHKLIKSKMPIAFADTETGSDFRLHAFEEAGIKLLVAKTRAFQDLLAIMADAEKEASVLIIDSITHFWNELLDSYMKKNELTRIRLKDWIPLKKTWREFTNRFISDPIHVIVCGRSADKWEEQADEEDGALELKKVGTKMRAETEMGYEPSLLIEMTAIQTSARVGSPYIRRAFVKKDRFDILDGKSFDNPTLDSFMPHIAMLNLGGEHKAIEPGRNSQDMFQKANTGEQKAISRDILIEKIEAEIKLLYPGQTEEDKKARINLMDASFGTKSWTEIVKRRSIDDLNAGLVSIQAITNEDGTEKTKKKGEKK